MTARRFALACFSLSILALLAPSLRAQEAAPETVVENSRYQIEGVINGNAVYVRSGPSENDYPTMQLSKSTPVTVVGERFTWLKITPPEGSFCYVAKAYVNRTGDGSMGQSTGTPYVRVGSSLNQLKTKIAGKLEPNQRVEIVGEQDEYFKIKPPADVYFYVNKQFVDPVRQIPAPGEAKPPEAQPPIARENAIPATQPQASNQQPDAPAQPERWGGPIAGATGAAPPATQPTVDPEVEFERLEKLYSAASQRPLDEQPLTELSSGYEQLVSANSLPESLRRIAEHKIEVLKGRAKMQQDFQAVKKSQEDLKVKQLALSTEQKEIEERISKSTVKFYAAVGMLRTSSMQFGQGTLYRLTDPANERTVVYIRSTDGKTGQRLGEFVGIRGPISVDAQRNMTIVTPTEMDTVDPSVVGQTVAATHTPPSLKPGIASGADGGQ